MTTTQHLTIGEFSSLSRISIRMLRHYDEHGLLRPDSVDQATGYRRYLPEQLADAAQMQKESTTAHARLHERTARKQQWRAERAAGQTSTPLKPAQNDRPEFVPGSAA